MPRVSKNIKELAEAHRKTMEKTPIFILWAYKFLRCKDRVGDYQKAYEYIHNGGKDDQETAGEQPTDGREDLSSL